MSAARAALAKRTEPPPWLLTLRLALHEITRHHANELYELDADPRVMRYIGSGRVSTRAQVDAVMRRLPRAYALYPGLGTWRATRRDNGDFVGWFALKYIPRTALVEVAPSRDQSRARECALTERRCGVLQEADVVEPRRSDPEPGTQ